MVRLTDGSSFTAIVQATNRCQLKCPYCMASKSKDELSREAVRKFVHGLNDLLPKAQTICFVWHGGEPLILGVEFYRWVKQVQRIAENNSGRKIINVLQTNGLLLTDAFLDFIQETADFIPNISMDGPDVITRKTRGISASTYDEVFSRLQKRNIRFGVAIVATNDVLVHKAEVVDYFKTRNIENIGLVPYHAFSDDEQSVDRFAPYHAPLPAPTILADLAFDLVSEQGITKRQLTSLGRDLFAGAVRQYFHSGCRFSSFDGNCHRRVLCLASDGRLYPCPRGQNVNLWCYGDIMQDGLDTWWKTTGGSPPFRPKLPTACEACRWEPICHGGCPANAKSMNGGAENRDYYCPSFISMFEEAERRVFEELPAHIASKAV